jgi:PAS domain-containing protein
MKDDNKTKKQLIDELAEQRKLIKKLESETDKQIKTSSRTDENHFSYKTFYEFSPIMYFTLDSEAKILAVNPTGAEILGYSEQELIGQSVLRVFHHDDRQALLEHFNNCISNPDALYSW